MIKPWGGEHDFFLGQSGILFSKLNKTSMISWDRAFCASFKTGRWPQAIWEYLGFACCISNQYEELGDIKNRLVVSRIISFIADNIYGYMHIVPSSITASASSGPSWPGWSLQFSLMMIPSTLQLNSITVPSGRAIQQSGSCDTKLES